TVIMTLDVNKDQPGATTPAGVQINPKHGKTEVLVENGGTVVIGGIYEQNDRTDITKVPLLGDLPLVGWLFKNSAVSTGKTELMVFITPRIVNERLTIRKTRADRLFAAPPRPGPPGRFCFYNALMKARGNLYLVGMMGAGKTPVGRLLARRL